MFINKLNKNKNKSRTKQNQKAVTVNYFFGFSPIGNYVSCLQNLMETEAEQFRQKVVSKIQETGAE